MNWEDGERIPVTITAYEERTAAGETVWDWHCNSEKGPIKHTMFFGNVPDEKGKTKSDKNLELLVAIGAKADELHGGADWKGNINKNVIGKRALGVVQVSQKYGAQLKYLNAFREPAFSPFGKPSAAKPDGFYDPPPLPDDWGDGPD